MSSESSPNSVDAFLTAAQQADATITGYIAWNPGNPSVVLFGKHPYYCPYVAIPKDQILDIHQGQIHRCSGPLGLSNMWYAKLLLKPAQTPEGKWLQVLLMEAFSESPTRGCDCGEGSAIGTLASCGSYRDAFKRDYPDYASETCWHRYEEYPASDAAGAVQRSERWVEEGARYARDRGWYPHVAIHHKVDVCGFARLLVTVGYKKV